MAAAAVAAVVVLVVSMVLSADSSVSDEPDSVERHWTLTGQDLVVVAVDSEQLAVHLVFDK